MPVLEKLKSMLGSEERTFVYRCQECDREFEATTPSASRAECPDCTKSRVVSVPGTTASN